MTVFDALLGRFFNSGSELELGAGVDCVRGVQAARNASTRRIDLSVDAPYVDRVSYRWRGDATAIPAGTSGDAQTLAINGSATTIAIASIVDVDEAVVLDALVWLAKSDGTYLQADPMSVALYRESATSEVHLIDVVTNTQVVGTGAQEITITAPSGQGYTFAAAYNGSLRLDLEGLDADIHIARARLWLGESAGLGL